MQLKNVYDFRPVAPTPIVMKCFKKPVLSQIIPCNLGHFRSVYPANYSTEDATVTVRMLFADFCSAFNTIIYKLVSKLDSLCLSYSLCTLIVDFLIDHSRSKLKATPPLLSSYCPEPSARQWWFKQEDDLLHCLDQWKTRMQQCVAAEGKYIGGGK